MFEDLIREIQKLEKQVAIPIDFELDDERYFDRGCPGEECGAAFKVLFEDWKDKVPDETAYCPICGLSATSSEWNTPDQQEQVRSMATRYMSDRLDQAMKTGVRRSKPTPLAGGLATMTLSYRPGRAPIVATAAASEAMTQKTTCENCGCRYSSVGAAFFCPACGHNNVVSSFDATVDAVRKTLAALPDIRRTLGETIGKDAAEDSARHICENGLVKLVSAFQRFSEAQFAALDSKDKPSPRRNAFQNLQESGDLWRRACGRGYEEALSASEHASLQRFFQQRHILSHNDGIVDQLYVDRSGDTAYAVGQRLVIRPAAVEQLAVLVSRLAEDLSGRSH